MNPRVYPPTRRIIAVDGGFVTRFNRGHATNKFRDDRFSHPRGRGRGRARGAKHHFTLRHEEERPNFRQYNNREWSPVRPRPIQRQEEERQIRRPSVDRPKVKPFRRSRSRSPQNLRFSPDGNRDSDFVPRFNRGHVANKFRDDRFSHPRGRGRGQGRGVKRPFPVRHEEEHPHFRQYNREWSPARPRVVHQQEEERRTRRPSVDRPRMKPFKRSRTRSPQNLRFSPDGNLDSTDTTTKCCSSTGRVTLYNPAEPTCDDPYTGDVVACLTPSSDWEGEVLISKNHRVTIPTHEPRVTPPTHEARVTPPTHEPRVTPPTHEPRVISPTHEARVTVPTHDARVTVPTDEAIQTVVDYKMKFDCTIARQRYESFFSRQVPQPKVFKRVKLNLTQDQIYSRFPNYVNNMGMSAVMDLLQIDEKELEGIVIPEAEARTRVIEQRQKLHRMCVNRFGEERMIKLMVHLDIKRKNSEINFIELYTEMLEKYERTTKINLTQYVYNPHDPRFGF